MNKLKLSVISGLIAIAFAAPAQAASMTSSLNIISTSTIGSGTLGTVTLTQNGLYEVDFSVALAANTAFVSTGGPHTAFTFNLSPAALAGYSVNIASPTGGIFTWSAGSSGNTPYGSFTSGIDCPGCGPGASNANPGPLTFSVTNSNGISLSDFMANSGGYYFAADVIGPNGGTGAIAAGNMSAVPEPSTYAMLLAGLGLIGFIALRKQRGGAMNFA